MKTAIQFITRLYIALLHLYPRTFHNEFADEMQNVFADSIVEAAKRGNAAVTWLCLKELRDLPGAILREHWQARRKSIMENKPHLSWLELFCTAIPFLLYLAVPIIEVLRFNLGGVGSLSLLGVIFVPLIVGLVKGLPRWSFPTMGLLLAILNYLVLGIITAILVTFTIIPIELRRELFGSGFMYIGILPLSLVILLVTALIKPLHPFFQRIRNDWTLFPFALYGIMPMVIFLSLNEYQGSVPYEIGMGLVLLMGLWLYLRITQLGRKLLVLGISITLAMAIEAIGKWILIPSQSWIDLLQPNSVEQAMQGEVTSTVYTWFWVTVVVLLPALLGGLPRPTRFTPATQP